MGRRRRGAGWEKGGKGEGDGRVVRRRVRGGWQGAVRGPDPVLPLSPAAGLASKMTSSRGPPLANAEYDARGGVEEEEDEEHHALRLTTR
ncbi:hypothetical protein HaLaN_12322 [Haematococcus lacustris]|uniref:Uncharacterized protein n=1 Tax=Haematococcus lacustris TaxID=44745 RepID=A0A699Z0B7_HAELA|nr:hypothetical protein HaLaN_12322 [Haematococcus lacustris]